MRADRRPADVRRSRQPYWRAHRAAFRTHMVAMIQEACSKYLQYQLMLTDSGDANN
jgi:hypothetical protein